ncbi:MAG: prepilin-type N-terminal cleavage/methylation domain-containing protein [bacterium]
MKLERGGGKGFTLIELMLVLTIMGLLTAAVAPAMRGFLQSQELPNAAKLFASSIRYCRSTAVHRSVRTRLVFDTENGHIRMEAEPSPLSEPGVFEEFPSPIPLQSILKKSATEIQMKRMTETGPEDIEQLEFMADGVILGANGQVSDVFIYLKGDDESEVYTIAVVGITGQVLVMDHEASTFYDEM